MFVISSLNHLGLRLPKLQNFNIKINIISPIPQKIDVLDSLIPKLEQKKMQFELKKNTSLISKIYASQNFDANNANAYTLIDVDTGQILAEKNSDQKKSIASLTKIMTAVIALDLSTPDELFTVSAKASNQIPSIIGLTPGEKLTLTELLNGALLMSGNDTAEVIREGIEAKYKDKIFIKAMNEKAQIIGLSSTHFTTPQGFDYGENYSSANDIARLTIYALKNYPLIKDIVKKSYSTLPANQFHKEFDMNNWNGLLGVYPDVNGVKIGYTGDAGYTTIVLSERNDKKILAVLLGAPGIPERDLWTAELLDFGYKQTLGLDPINITRDRLQAKYNSWYN